MYDSRKVYSREGKRSIMNYLDTIIEALNYLDGLAHISEICDYIK